MIKEVEKISDFLLEIAKNGEFTCKYSEGKDFKYIYSKYNPSKINYNWKIDKNADCIALIGIGLGYEYKYLKSITEKPIFVLEPLNFFKDFIKKENNLNPMYIGRDFLELSNYKNVQVLKNEQLFKLGYLQYPIVEEKLTLALDRYILVVDHVTISRDCVTVFEKLGYRVVYISLTNSETEINEKSMPKFIFSINFYGYLAELAERINILYISWTVDTPCYSLFDEDNKTYKNSFIFHYDELVVEKLKKLDVSNVYYLPVAANVNRFNQTTEISMEPIDVSFVGHSCGHNEYENYIKYNLNEKDQEIVTKIVEKQLSSQEFNIEKELPEQLCDNILSLPALQVLKPVLKMMKKQEVVGLLIGRQHSFIERQILVNVLESNFNFKVYGDHFWEKTNISSYAGNAEHYYEMPQIFKSSKININLIRSFVDSGLPMRVFDILGCGGFLLTNKKNDILRYFEDGEHLVIFSDFDDLVKKVKYYIDNEEERKRIAKNGYEEVKKNHSFEIRIQTILNLVFNENLKNT